MFPRSSWRRTWQQFYCLSWGTGQEWPLDTIWGLYKPPAIWRGKPPMEEKMLTHQSISPSKRLLFSTADCEMSTVSNQMILVKDLPLKVIICFRNIFAEELKLVMNIFLLFLWFASWQSYDSLTVLKRCTVL